MKGHSSIQTIIQCLSKIPIEQDVLCFIWNECKNNLLNYLKTWEINQNSETSTGDLLILVTEPTVKA